LADHFGERKERPHFSVESVEAELLRRVGVAWASLRHAMEEFHGLRTESPEGAEPTVRLKEAAQAHRNAIDAYRLALKQFNDFMRGTFPDDL